MRRFLINGIRRDDKTVIISGEEFHRLSKVLRLKCYDKVVLFDGRGLELYGRIESIRRGKAVVSIEGVKKSGRESSIEIVLIQGILKGRKMNTVIQKATELGVSAIQPFYTARTVPKLTDERIENRVVRWNKIAEEAARQCGRSFVPLILPPVNLGEAVKDYDRFFRVMLWESLGERMLKGLLREVQLSERGRIAVLVGPEGGLSDKDFKKASACGFVPAGLGTRILRAETAAISILAIIQYEVGDIG